MLDTNGLNLVIKIHILSRRILKNENPIIFGYRKFLKLKYISVKKCKYMHYYGLNVKYSP